MAASGALYNFLFRRNYVFLGFVFTSAFAFEISFDRLMDRIWDKNNAGVSLKFNPTLLATITKVPCQRQWKDIRSRYIQNGDEE
ncbi:Cytochrome b-c1 complex subunit 9, mitochondrial, partial [Erysiphe necator]